MFLHVTEATYVRDFQITLIFSDGSKGVIDFRDELDGPIFEPLKQVEYFKRFHINDITGTIEWPNEADFAPEFLYEKIKRQMEEREG